MRTAIVNWDYLKFYQEIPISWALSLTRTRRPADPDTRDVLIVNPCLVGEFAASALAMGDFIRRNPGRAIDLVVSPPLRALAERIRGVRRVYVARSLYQRRNEGGRDEGDRAAQEVGSYHRVMAMRASVDAYRLMRRIRTGEMRTNARRLISYGWHLSRCMRLRRTPRSWSEVCFGMLGGTPVPLGFDDIFAFGEDERLAAAARPELRGSGRRILIHTNASWITKCWPLDNWVALLARLHALADIVFVFVGHGAEAEREHAYIAARLPFRTESLIGEIGLHDLLLVMRHCDYFLGVDSGPANLAHLADLPSVKLLGPAPHMYNPPNARDIAVDRSNGRGILEHYLAVRNPIVERITVDDAYDAFAALFATVSAAPGPRG